jgi:hypothetical protein
MCAAIANSGVPLDSMSFWVKHSRFSKLLARTKKFGLIFIGFPIAVAIGGILALTEIFLRIALSHVIGKAFSLMNIFLLVGKAFLLGVANVMQENNQGNKEANNKRITKEMKTYVDNIVFGFIHIVTGGLFGNLNFFQNKSDEKFNQNIRNPFGIKLGREMLEGLHNIIKKENDYIIQLNYHENPRAPRGLNANLGNRS